ncbi:hypothetical protein ACFLXO_05720 [Chloroflexota bacterium]
MTTQSGLRRSKEGSLRGASPLSTKSFPSPLKERGTKGVRQKMTRKERIISNLSKYPSIRKFLGNAVRKRLEIKGYTRGILTAHLLDGEPSNLEGLEQVLELGEKYCTDFKLILKGMNLPNRDLAIDGEIINTLAEVKAFEVLYSNHFENIKKIRPARGKTVDFTATHKGQNYAVEVTRIGIPESPKKASEPYLVESLTDDADNLAAKLMMYTPDTKKIITDSNNKQVEMSNYEIWSYSIESAVKAKYKQLEQYISSNDNRKTKGIIFVSSGRDYFVLCKYARGDMFLTNTMQRICQKLFLKLKKEGSYPYLHHLIFNLGKQAKEPVVFPLFDCKGASY